MKKLSILLIVTVVLAISTAHGVTANFSSSKRSLLDFVPVNPDSYPGKPPKMPSYLGPKTVPKDPGPVLLIMMDFVDQPGGALGGSATHYNDLMFGNSFGSMKHYYLEVSYGILSVSGTIAPGGWYRSAQLLSWWGADGPSPTWNGYPDVYGDIDCVHDAIFNLAREAVQLADVNIDFSQFDTNHNHVIDPGELFLVIVHSGPDEAATGNPNDIWSHSWYIGGPGWPDPYHGNPNGEQPVLIVDGCRMSNDGYDPNDYTGGYVMLAEDSPLGTFAHEFGHALGLPDLYDTDYSSYGIGRWCLMSFGSWNGPPGAAGTVPAELCAWCKIQLGWITPTTVTYHMSTAVPQVETNPVVYKLVYTSTEYFLAENRERTGYDAYLRGSGLLIWHIDESMPDNTNEKHRLVDLEEAHGGVQNMDYYYPDPRANSGDVKDPFYQPNKSYFTDTSDPNCTSYPHSPAMPTGLWVTEISATGPMMTATFLQVPVGGEWAPIMLQTLGPISTIQLLAPLIGIAVTTAVVTSFVGIRRFKKRRH